MLISTKGRYAMRVMLDLAARETSTYVPLKEMAEEQGISVKYMESIITTLSKAGLVEGVRGKKGGYRLTKSRKNTLLKRLSGLRTGRSPLLPVSVIQIMNATGKKNAK